MSVEMITQFRTKEGRSEELIVLIGTLIPDSLKHHGCEKISIRQNQDEPNDIISAQCWASGRRYQSYAAWRREDGVSALLAEPVSVRYFDDAQMGRSE